MTITDTITIINRLMMMIYWRLMRRRINEILSSSIMIATALEMMLPVVEGGARHIWIGQSATAVVLVVDRLRTFRRIAQILALVLVPPILEPYLHLGRRHLQTLRHLLAFRRRQVLLQLEALLQLVDLGLGE